MEQILINYTNDGDTFFISMISGDKARFINEHSEEADNIIRELKEIVERYGSNLG